MELFEKMTDEKNVAEAFAWFKKMNLEKEFEKTTHRIAASQKRKRFWQYAVAASLIIAVSTSVYLYTSQDSKVNNPPIAKQETDIQPGSDKATLTLENGTIVTLNESGKDSSINDQIKLLQKQGEIMYAGNQTFGELLYHTLTIPRKGHYKLVLPDGSKVWLNAESSIRYPTSFSDKERRVFVTGETFFEVAKDAKKPFRVVADDMIVEALGTQFNINVYLNEPFFTTTLVEGSVLLSKGKNENILKPGQQAQLSEGDFQIVNTEVAEATAWKNNQFKFVNTSVETIMRQIERWYDAEVIYQDKVNLHLNATIGRDVPVSRLLHLLEQTGQVHFKIEGRKIYVTQ
jgi:ferric-dicitrate binding protein FerR (iron transport regulator)